MSSILVINAAGRETRVALIENGHIAEFYLERKKDKGIVGNIYKGRVVRVLPGMQAAFVDIGLEKAAFLYVTDVFYDPDFSRAQFELTEGEHEDAPDSVEVPEHSEEALAQTLGQDVPAEAAAAKPESTEGATVPTLEAPAANVPEQVPPNEAPLPVAEAVGLPEEASAPATSSEPTSEGEERGERRSSREERLRHRHGQGRDDRARNRDADKFRPRQPAKIEDLLKVGQQVLVQISKDPIGSKGARLTCHISIPGRHLVFMPTVDHVGISRRISNEKERRRLRETVDRLRPAGTGFIVRTVAENVPQEKLESDIRFLIEVWNACVRRNEKMTGQGLLHPDLDLILRATRDLFARDVEKLVVDDRDEYERVLTFVSAQDPALRDRILLHEDEEPIFDAYGIEQELNRAVQRKVWLKSGGYLVIDQAEALTAIDVNSGRYVGKKSLEETITKINVEAAKEIVYQLRLRNIGGIIICDFIDMEKPSNRDRVFKTLQEALGRDKAKTNVLRISELGLVEMTRKRVRESIGRVLHEDCAYCDGRGFVKTATSICYQIFREIRREAPNYKEPVLVINCNNDVAKLLAGEERQELRHLMDRYNKSILVKAQQSYHREQYDIYGRPAQVGDHKLAAATTSEGAGNGSDPAKGTTTGPLPLDHARGEQSSQSESPIHPNAPPETAETKVG